MSPEPSGRSTGTLVFAADGLRKSVREYLKCTATAWDLPNWLATAPVELAETVQSDADTQYVLGGFYLADGEWLEQTMPAGLSGH